MSDDHALTQGVVAVAERLADEVLFPAALATDASDAVPVELLDALADAGLYGIAGPIAEGGLDADFPTVCSVVEALASGCLTTAFVWIQHMGAVRAAATSPNEAMAAWVAPLCSGERRAGLALGGAVPGPPALTARERPGGWSFDGTSPFVSGWGLIHVMHAAARTADGRLVWALVDAAETETLGAVRLDLVALNATATVRTVWRDHHVPADRVTSVSAYQEGPTPPEVLRIHASLALGVAARCLRLIGQPSRLADDVEQTRRELDRLDPSTIQAARAEAGELAMRSAQALCVSTGSRSLLTAGHEQRLFREALFTLVYALRPGSRTALLERLGGAVD
jgi:alkylation response protein AidB-like acyl-CoA dehydrogenase